MRVRTLQDRVHRADRGRATRARLVIATILGMCAAGLSAITTAAPAAAVQATGDNVAVWQNGNSWTYNTSFRYQGDGTDVTINENVTYSVAGVETFQGHDAYKLNINGTITGGSGSVDADGTSATLDNFSGNVTGTRFVRRSDLALLQENQNQHLNADGHVSFITVGITADIELHLTPDPSWKVHDFPLNAGDSWQTSTDIAYTGGFTYDAGSLGGSGSDTFDGTLDFDGPSNVTSTTVNAGGNSSLPVKRVYTQNADNTMSDDSYWSPQFKNQAKETLKLPLDGATVTLNRTLTSASTSAGTTISATATPSYTCAGGSITVAGNLSSSQAGQTITARLDQSQINPGQGTSATATTGANGAYSLTLPVPAQADGLAKTGAQPSRANWGILLTGGGGRGATTVVVSPKDCTTLAYTGATSGPQTGTATVSAQLTDLASASSAAGKTVTFSLSGGATVNATTNASGVATATMAVAGPPRAATISASFAGNASMEAASASTGFTVTTIPTDTAVVATPDVVNLGDNVSFGATITPSFGASVPSGGTVQFQVDGSDFGSPVPVSAGTAASAPFGTGSLSIGFHDVTAIYSGSADHAGSQQTAQFRVRPVPLPSTTTQVVTPTTAVAGQNVHLESTSKRNSDNAPITGEVTFRDGATVLGTVSTDANGVATLDLVDLAVGSHSITASYTDPTEVYADSATSPTGVAITKASSDTSLTSSAANTVTGEAVTFTASVAPVAPSAGTPTGSVQLVIDGSNVGAPVALSAGAASFPAVTDLGAGAHTVAVSYPGDANFTASGDSITQNVAKADTAMALTSGPSPQVEEDPVTITATVAAVAPGSGAPTGTVNFFADGDAVGSAALAPASGGGSEAVFTTAFLPVGSSDITAVYAGDADYNGSNGGPVTQVVVAATQAVQTTTTVTSSKNPSTYGELITFTAEVVADDNSQPDGAVQFSVDGTDIGGPVPVGANGLAESPTLASPEPGDHLVIAAFVPVSAYTVSGDSLIQQVQNAGASVALSSSNASSTYGQAVTFTAEVSSDQIGTGVPGGFVQFRVDGEPLGDAVAVDGAGEAVSPAVSNLAPGSHAVTALYSGDTHFLPASASLTQDVGKIGTTTALTASTTSPTYGDAVTLTATVTPGSSALGAPTGSIAFKEGGTTLATVPLSAVGGNGKATLTTSALTGGPHVIKAVYSGAAAFEASASGNVTVTVAKKATSLYADAALLRLNPLLGINIGYLKATLTSGGQPLAGKPIVFKIGPNTACVATTNSAGVADCDALGKVLQLTLAGGFTATYAGDGNYEGSTDKGGLIK